MKHLIIMLFSLVLIAGCVQSSNEPLDEQALKTATEPVIDNILKSYNAKDYAAMTKDFSSKMVAALGPAEIEKFAEGKLRPEAGEYVDKEFSAIEYDGPWVSVQYKVSFSKGVKRLMKTTFKKGDVRYRVEGLFFVPITKKLEPETAKSKLGEYKDVVESYFAALEAKDWEGMTKNYAAALKEKLTPEQEKESFEQDIFAVVGQYKSHELLEVEAREAFLVINMVATFESGQKGRFQFVFYKNDDSKKIQGLWYQPLPMEMPKEEAIAYYNSAKRTIDNFLESISNRKWEEAQKDFDDTLTEKLPAEKLAEVVEEKWQELGKLLDWNFWKVEKIGGRNMIYMKSKYEKGDPHTWKFVYEQGKNPSKIIGIWIAPVEE